jgi:hypothetical protein
VTGSGFEPVCSPFAFDCNGLHDEHTQFAARLAPRYG